MSNKNDWLDEAYARYFNSKTSLFLSQGQTKSTPDGGSVLKAPWSNVEQEIATLTIVQLRLFAFAIIVICTDHGRHDQSRLFPTIMLSPREGDISHASRWLAVRASRSLWVTDCEHGLAAPHMSTGDVLAVDGIQYRVNMIHWLNSSNSLRAKRQCSAVDEISYRAKMIRWMHGLSSLRLKKWCVHGQWNTVPCKHDSLKIQKIPHCGIPTNVDVRSRKGGERRFAVVLFGSFNFQRGDLISTHGIGGKGVNPAVFLCQPQTVLSRRFYM